MNYPHEPLEKDTYAVTEGDLVLRFERKKNSPNLNFFEVFLGRKNIGYISQPHFSPKWFAISSFPTDGKDVVDSFPEAMAAFFWRILND